MSPYHTIEKAIQFIQLNYQYQPSLKEIADHVHVSEHHFQKMFKQWSGISPKKYLQWITLNKAKQLIALRNESILSTTYETGLSSTARLHDLFVTFEGLTPGEYKNAGKDIHIIYGFYESIFGKYILASTVKGICFLMFGEDEADLEFRLFQSWPLSKIEKIPEHNLELSQKLFHQNARLSLFTKGTPFQLSVWRALINIQSGETKTYQQISTEIKRENANRAVGSAVGRNEIAYLIPCHRVIRNDGLIGQYRWGIDRKRCILNYELCQRIQVNE